MPIWFEIVARLAPLATATVGIAALLYARQQIRINRENEAKRQFLNFLDECIKYPMLAGDRHGNGVKLDGQEQEFRYHWFLSKLLMASESILEVTQGDMAWRSAVIENLRAHLPYIRDGNVRYQSYSLQLQSLIKAEMARLDSNVPNSSGEQASAE
jgi:hypothetical protein